MLLSSADIGLVLASLLLSCRFNSANDESERGFSSRYRTSVCAVPVAREAPALTGTASAPAAAAVGMH